MKSALERDVRLVRFEDGTLELALETARARCWSANLPRNSSDWTGRRWMVAVSAEAGAPSVRAQAEMRKAVMKDDVRGDPLVQAVLARFPGAEIVEVRRHRARAPSRTNARRHAGGDPNRKRSRCLIFSA